MACHSQFSANTAVKSPEKYAIACPYLHFKRLYGCQREEELTCPINRCTNVHISNPKMKINYVNEVCFDHRHFSMNFTQKTAVYGEKYYYFRYYNMYGTLIYYIYQCLYNKSTYLAWIVVKSLFGNWLGGGTCRCLWLRVLDRSLPGVHTKFSAGMEYTLKTFGARNHPTRGMPGTHSYFLRNYPGVNTDVIAGKRTLIFLVWI